MTVAHIGSKMRPKLKTEMNADTNTYTDIVLKKVTIIVNYIHV